MVALIKNEKRKRQFNEFQDKDHAIMSSYYEVFEEKLPAEQLLKTMNIFITADPDFYDPYLDVAEILRYQDKNEEADTLIKTAYERAVKRIADSQGRWPKSMLWGFLENRHIMRAINVYADLCWQEKRIDEALDIYRRLLHVNPNDNQGVRNNILAIRMNLDYETWDDPFKVNEEYLDGFKMSAWFHENALKFPDEFKWLLEFHGDAA